jgi:enolase
MTASAITEVEGWEALDSRGRPTVGARVRLAGGLEGTALVPSGASTGAREAHELRDGDPARRHGLGVLRAVAHVNGEIRDAVMGLNAGAQKQVDAAMRSLDGTPGLSRLGANAVLAVSLAVARAGAAAAGFPLYKHIARLYGGAEPSLPMPMVNILSGGLHAGHGMDIQDFLVIPVGAATYAQALDWSLAVRQSAADLMAARGLAILLADEGGLSPGFADSREALTLMVQAIEAAGLRPGEDAAIALDVAASGLAQMDGRYAFPRAGETLTAPELIDRLAAWARDFPIVSIEDGLGENDVDHWPALTERLAHIQIVGDDLFCTNPFAIGHGRDHHHANAALIKVNQAGTLSAAIAATWTALEGGMGAIVSARSGETEDDFIADLAVGTGAGQIKIGSLRGAERLTKYTRLSRIEAAEGLPFAGRTRLAVRRRR